MTEPSDLVQEPLLAPINELWERPHEHGFYAALSLLERWHIKEGGLPPDEALAPIRFRHSVSRGFPPSEIEALRRLPAPAGPEVADGGAEKLGRVEITPAFIGLIGPSGTLPGFYTERIAAREPAKGSEPNKTGGARDPARDGSARAFLDIFLQRSALMLYKAWRKHRLPLQYEVNPRGSFLPLVLSIAGLGQEGLRNRLKYKDGEVADESIAYYAGLLQQRPVSAATVRQILSHQFGMPVTVHEFVGRWYSLPPAQRSILGLGRATLNTDAVVGDRVWQSDLRVRLDLGPMSLSQLHRMLPGQPGALALRELLTLLTGVTLEYEIRLVLRGEDVCGATLGEMAQREPSQDASRAKAGAAIHSSPTPVRLGFDSFLCPRKSPVCRDDARYLVHAAA